VQSHLGSFFFTFAFPQQAYLPDETGSFEFDGKERHYNVYLPWNFQPNMPLVLNLHGYTWSIEDHAKYRFMHNIADTLGFIVVYPAGSVASNGKSGWNNGLRDHPFGPNITDTTSNDVGFLSALIDTLYADYNINLDHVYCCGFSMGGEMTYRMAIEMGNRFAAFASVAGKINDVSANSGTPTGAFPILHFHGTNDNVETYYGENDGNLWPVEESIKDCLENNNCDSQADTLSVPDIDPNDGSTVQKISYLNCSEESQVIFFRIFGGGHGWPGSTIGMYPDGNPNRDINASEEISNFFFQDYENPYADNAFGRTLEIFPYYIRHQGDSLWLTAGAANPENHQLKIFTKIRGTRSTIQDSIELFNDGMHGDGTANDDIWGGTKWFTYLAEDIYTAQLSTCDITEGTTHLLSNQCRFTTIGPLVLDNFEITSSDTIVNPSDRLKFQFTLRNIGSTAPAENITSRITALDTFVTVSGEVEPSYGDIATGETVTGDKKQYIKFGKNCPVDSYQLFNVDIYSDGIFFWQDTMSILVKSATNIDDAFLEIPDRFVLSQNYPNPNHHLHQYPQYLLPLLHPVHYQSYISAIARMMLKKK